MPHGEGSSRSVTSRPIRTRDSERRMQWYLRIGMTHEHVLGRVVSRKTTRRRSVLTWPP